MHSDQVTVNLQLKNLCHAPRFAVSMLYSMYAFSTVEGLACDRNPTSFGELMLQIKK